MGYITKREKLEKIRKLNKTNNVMKYFMIIASFLSIALIIFLVNALIFQAMGNDSLKLFVLTIDGAPGKLIGNIDNLTVLGWATLVEIILVVILDIVASVLTIVFKSYKKVINEAIEIVNYK